MTLAGAPWFCARRGETMPRHLQPSTRAGGNWGPGVIGAGRPSAYLQCDGSAVIVSVTLVVKPPPNVPPKLIVCVPAPSGASIA